ncbi:MAG: SBBP repeat-containing protein [Pyrinomonadaceae bacterium]
MTLTFQRRYVRIFLVIAFLIVGLITSVPMRFDSPLNGSSPKTTITDSSSRPENRGLSDVASTGIFSSASKPGGLDRVLQSRVANTYGKLPLSFEANHGQADDEVKFISRGSGYTLLLTSTDAVLRISKSAPTNKVPTVTSDPFSAKTSDVNSTEAELRMKLVGANPKPEVTGIDKQAGKSNYFIGNDPAKWRTNVSHYARVQYKDVYRGVNVVYYGTQRQLEYDFVVEPGTDPGVIKMAFDGASAMHVDSDGSLRLQMRGGELRQSKPLIYQQVNGERKEISGRYLIRDNRVGFEVAEYDRSQPLVIDPVLSYSSYLGGSGEDIGLGIAVDSFGNAYVTGFTTSNNFPTVNSLSPGADFRDVFVTKVNAAGTALVYSTYLGGNNFERGQSIAVDSSGHAYVTGRTSSGNFPRVTPIQSGLGGSEDVFVTKLSANGSELLYSTYIGGAGPEDGRGIVVDAAGSAYVTGQTDSPNFPTGSNSFQPTFGGSRFGGDAFVTKLNPAGSALVYSTFLGGHDYDEGNAIALDSFGNAYITGATHSPNFPTANGFQSTINSFCSSPGAPIAPCFDAFITKLNPTGSALVYSTFLGGFGRDEGHAIALDSSGSIYVAGETNSGNFPVANAFQPHLTGSGSFIAASDAFITKFNPAGSALVYSTYLGGQGHGEILGGMVVDAQGNAYVTGHTGASDFPTTDSMQPMAGSGDAFITKLSASGSALVFSTFFGGTDYEESNAIAVDTAGNAYITGRTWGSFPTEKPFQPFFGGGGINEGDAFVAKIGTNNIPAPTVLSISAVTPNRGGNTAPVSVTIHGSHFVTGASVKLVLAGQADIVPTSMAVSEGGTLVRARFDFTGQATGLRDLLLTNPDGASATYNGAIDIREGGQPQAWVELFGRESYRAGRAQTFHIAYGNHGNVDATGVPVFISFPRGIAWKLGFQITRPTAPPWMSSDEWNNVPVEIERDGRTYIALIISRIAAGESRMLSIQLTTPAESEETEISVMAWIPRRPPPRFLYAAASVTVANVNTSTTSLTSKSLAFVDPNSSAQSGLPPLVDEHCQGAFVKSIFTIGEAVPVGCVLGAVNGFYGSITNAAIDDAIATPEFYTFIDLGLSFGGVAATCAGRATLGKAFDAAAVGFSLGTIVTSCTPLDEWLVKIISRLRGFDPNGKVGANGFGDRRYLSGEEPFRYAVFFENLESANAPAQDVVITDQLDSSKLDFDTFSLGPISFGKDKLIIPPFGLSEFTTDVDLRPANNLIVRINAKLDKPTGLLTWRFTSLDASTGLPTEDPTAGFLPPNLNAPEGEGQVLFTVQPKQGIATGTEIRNHARMVFDTNAPIDTPEWLNTIDNSKPTSRVLPLPATQCATGINLQWSGTDAGSGLSDFTILVSDNNGPIVPLLSNTTASSTVFPGQVGHTYSFYSIARDNTQNFEEPRSSPDTTVTIVAVSPPAITAPPAITVGTGAIATFCGAFISDAALGSAVANGNCLGVTVTREGVPANHFFPVGNTVIKYTATDGAGNTSSASQLVTVIDNTPPKIGDVIVDKPSLWPPNHKMVDVALRYDSADNCGPTTCQVNITSNEPINGTGDGDSCPDWGVLDSHRVRLRAERSGKGKGRVYLVKVTCADRARNSTSRTAAVTVPSNGK